MASYYSISGTLELDEQQLSKLREILSANLDGNSNQTSWMILENAGWSNYAFFGHTINARDIASFRVQLERIAIHVFSFDGEFIDFTRGFFRAIHDGDYKSYEWDIFNGKLHERELA